MYENSRGKQNKITNHLQPHQKANEGLQQLHHPKRYRYLFELSRYVEATRHGINVTVSNFVKVNIRGAMNHNEGPVQPAWKFGNEMDDAVLGRPSFEHGTTAMALIPAGIWRRLVT